MRHDDQWREYESVDERRSGENSCATGAAPAQVEFPSASDGRIRSSRNRVGTTIELQSGARQGTRTAHQHTHATHETAGPRAREDDRPHAPWTAAPPAQRPLTQRAVVCPAPVGEQGRVARMPQQSSPVASDRDPVTDRAGRQSTTGL
jgi:hypothetical protein